MSDPPFHRRANALMPGLALAVALLPVLAVHVSLLLAISSGAIAGCIPYLEGCTSISAIGRSMPASFVFKPAMTSQWLLLCAYWAACVGWLKLVRGHRARVDWVILALGCAGALALVVYVTYLGTGEPFYQFMRRFGIYGYFLGTVIAQLLMARQVRKLARLPARSNLARLARWQFHLAALPFALGLLNLALKQILVDADPAENIIEWVAAACMQAAFLTMAWCWSRTAYSLNGSIAPPQRGAEPTRALPDRC